MQITSKHFVATNPCYKNGQTRWVYAFKFDFTDRESYLTYRKDWKNRLAQYISDRRAWRIPRWDKSVAHQLEQERQAAKQEAQRLYLASKQTVPA